MKTDDRPEPRWNLIRHVQEQIAAGRYAAPRKLEIAVMRALEHVANEEDAR